MKLINEQVARIRKMMGLNENVNEFFSTPGEREGLPEPVDEEGGKKDYSKLEAALQKDGARHVAIRLVDAIIYKMTGVFTASDLPDTATYANGLDSIEESLNAGDYQAAYSIAKETASDMLEEEGYSDFLGEKELSDKQKNVASQAPPYDNITGADFKAMRDKKDVDEMKVFPFDDEEQDQYGGQKPSYNKELIQKYVDAIERRFRIKKLGVTPAELYQTFNYTDEILSRADIEMIMYTLSQKGLLFSDPTYKNKIQPNEVNQYLEFNDPKQHTDTEKLAMQALDRNMNETVTITKENMFKALSEAKKNGKVNPWAVCTASVGRDDKDKYERCVMGVKKSKGLKK